MFVNGRDQVSRILLTDLCNTRITCTLRKIANLAAYYFNLHVCIYKLVIPVMYIGSYLIIVMAFYNTSNVLA